MNYITFGYVFSFLYFLLLRQKSKEKSETGMLINNRMLVIGNLLYFVFFFLMLLYIGLTDEIGDLVFEPVEFSLYIVSLTVLWLRFSSRKLIIPILISCFLLYSKWIVIISQYRYGHVTGWTNTDGFLSWVYSSMSYSVLFDLVVNSIYVFMVILVFRFVQKRKVKTDMKIEDHLVI